MGRMTFCRDVDCSPQFRSFVYVGALGEALMGQGFVGGGQAQTCGETRVCVGASNARISFLEIFCLDPVWVGVEVGLQDGGSCTSFLQCFGPEEFRCFGRPGHTATIGNAAIRR
jgi:hypothetical protein